MPKPRGLRCDNSGMGSSWGSRGVFRNARPDTLHVASDTGEGPVVILVPGVASSSTIFDRLVPLLSGKFSGKYRVIAIDLLGFGGSPAPEDATYTVEEHVAWLRATITSLRLKAPFILVGHSLGGLLASRYAAQHPGEVSRLVLVSPPIYLAPRAIGDPRMRAVAGAYLRAYEFLRENKAFTIRNAAVLTRLMPVKNSFEITEANWRAFVLSMENCIESQTTVSDIAAVRVPVEIVYGTLDPFIVPAGMRIVEQMRHVTVHRVRANDHVIRPRLARAVAKVIG
jgi:pimeloyl-ACP methyl ester carboxylesterase